MNFLTPNQKKIVNDFLEASRTRFQLQECVYDMVHAESQKDPDYITAYSFVEGYTAAFRIHLQIAHSISSVESMNYVMYLNKQIGF